MVVGDVGKGDLVPAAAGGKSGIVEKAGLSGLRQADQRHGSRAAALAVASSPEARATKSSRLAPVAASTLARLSVDGQRSFPLAAPRLLLLKVVGSRPGELGQTGGRHAVPGGERVDGAPDLEMGQHSDIRNQSGFAVIIPIIRKRGCKSMSIGGLT